MIRNEVTDIWKLDRGPKAQENPSDSDGSEIPDSNSDFLEEINNYSRRLNEENPKKELKRPQSEFQDKLKELSIVILENISIPSSAAWPQATLNLRQSFKFSASLKPSKQISTQTSVISAEDNASDTLRKWQMIRSASLPPENAALTNLEKRVHADVQPQWEMIGDGNGQRFNENQAASRTEFLKDDLEISHHFQSTPVECVIIKPKSCGRATPKFNCKKTIRPQTKYRRQAFASESQSETSTMSNRIVEISRKPYLRRSQREKQLKEVMSKKPGRKLQMISNLSTDGEMSFGGDDHSVLSGIADKLQKLDWEDCMQGLNSLKKSSSVIDWESDEAQKFIPIISRKLIDFFKSPRSNLCRTACQTAGEFFITARSTKRPEFDEMVDLLLCRTADPNRFIQNDARDALDKMAVSICIHHSVRAICSKAPDHKNSIVRASTARVLYYICKHAGIDHIVGSDANSRTRKRVLINLGKFLMDKNLDTRKHAERLCKMLKRHKFFAEYFFKEIDSNYKNSLRKIVNSIDEV